MADMKRVFDIFVSFLALMVLFPILILITVFIAIYQGRPALFRQRRPGKSGELFEMLKFRTMREELGANGAPLPDKERMTKIGKLLRSTSLDELPEFWNVLKGDMSLVGPRPLLIEYLPLYSSEQARRHEVQPGITGWAQVNGRNALSWEEKFDLDVWYVDHQSMWLDIKILLMTVRKVLLRDGISQSGETTMSKFTGSEK